MLPPKNLNHPPRPAVADPGAGIALIGRVRDSAGVKAVLARFASNGDNTKRSNAIAYSGKVPLSQLRPSAWPPGITLAGASQCYSQDWQTYLSAFE